MSLLTPTSVSESSLLHTKIPLLITILISSACCYNYLVLYRLLLTESILAAECRSLCACPPSLGSGPVGDVIFHSVILSPYDLLNYDSF